MIRYLTRAWANPRLRAVNDTLIADARLTEAKLAGARHALSEAVEAQRRIEQLLLHEQEDRRKADESASRLLAGVQDDYERQIRELQADLGAARDENRRLQAQLASALNVPPLAELAAAVERRHIRLAGQSDAARQEYADMRAMDGLGDR
jgi:hypothetical protein